MPDRATASFIITGTDAIPVRLRPSVVAIGNFDGMHRGHQLLLEKAVTEARSRALPAVMMTFEPHPRDLFHPDSPVFRLTPEDAKARIAMALGFDAMVVVPFDRQFSALPAVDFVEGILVERLAIDTAVVGYNFYFGSGRSGSPDFLAAAGERLGFRVIVFEQVTDQDGSRISSGIVRAFLEDGNIERANAVLGYRWFATGTVTQGDQRGRLLRFPTANIRLPVNCGLRHGIYAVTYRGVDQTDRPAVASFGRRPTFDNGAPLLEVHIFDFAGDLYGEDATVTFVDWIRPEEKFPDMESLMAEMDRDAALTRKILATAGPGTALDRRLAGET